jgi:UDPglucose--hexose-1-phosphate uridylyltransferase
MTGRWVTIAAERSSRPADFVSRQLPVESDPNRPCPFCPGNEEATPPALETYGPHGSWLVRVVPNRYPAFDGSGPLEIDEVSPVFVQANGKGIHEVLVLTPDHERDWSRLDDREAGLVMAAVRDRMEEHGRSAAVRYTQAIVNHGREAGASLEHPHGQLLGIPFVPGELADEQQGFAHHDDRHGNCLLCQTVTEELDAGHRIVTADDRVVVVCPFWSGTPYEMLVVPRCHEAHLARAAPADVVAVGRALRDALAALRNLMGDAAYNLVFHTAPHRDGGGFHWHVHVVPRLSSVAGFEQGTGVLINIVAPEAAAAQLTGRGG